MNIMKTVIICSLALCGNILTMHNEHSEPSKSNTITNALIGALAGTGEIVVNQPLIYFKNTLQRGGTIEWFNPKVWYRGFGMNVAAMGPTTAFQTATNAALESVMPGKKASTMLSRAFLAGVASALLCAPIELVILDQQKNNRNMLETMRGLIKEAGWRVLTRGWLATALREGPWSVAYLVGFPIAQEAIKNQIDNPLAANIGAYVGAGALTGSAVALVTHPVDTIKTCMQTDYQGTAIKNMRGAIHNIYATRGIRGFFSGVAPRTINCGLAVPLMGTLNMYLSKKIEEGRS